MNLGILTSTLALYQPFLTDPGTLRKIKNSQLSYLHYRAEKDPARGMFNRSCDSEWTEEYIHGFLFDLERQRAIDSA